MIHDNCTLCILVTFLGQLISDTERPWENDYHITTFFQIQFLNWKSELESEKEIRTEREIFHQLVHPGDGRTLRAEPGGHQKLKLWVLSVSFMTVVRIWTLESPTASTWPLAGCWFRSQASGTLTSVTVRCVCLSRWLPLLWHGIDWHHTSSSHIHTYYLTVYLRNVMDSTSALLYEFMLTSREPLNKRLEL